MSSIIKLLETINPKDETLYRRTGDKYFYHVYSLELDHKTHKEELTPCTCHKKMELYYKKAFKYYLLASNENKDDIDAIYNLAYLYEKGSGVEQNYDKALLLYQEAYKKGHSQASNGIANICFRQKNVEMAVKWFRTNNYCSFYGIGV